VVTSMYQKLLLGRCDDLFMCFPSQVHKGDCCNGARIWTFPIASHPDLQARFLRESALRKPSFLADIDLLDCTIRSEIMTSVQGAPAMTAGGDDTYRRSHTSSASLAMRASSTATSHTSRMQLPLIPCYALTVDVDDQRTSVSQARTLYLAVHTH
jgi:hypothetical protein